MPVYHWAPLKKQQHTADFQRRTHTTGWWSRPAAVPPRAHTPTAPHGTGSRARQEQGHRTPSLKAAVRLQLQIPRQPGRHNPLTSRATLGPARRLPMVRPRPPRMRRGSPRAAALERSGAGPGRTGWVPCWGGPRRLPAPVELLVLQLDVALRARSAWLPHSRGRAAAKALPPALCRCWPHPALPSLVVAGEGRLREDQRAGKLRWHFLVMPGPASPPLRDPGSLGGCLGRPEVITWCSRRLS